MTIKNKPLSDEDIPFDKDMEQFLEEDYDTDSVLFQDEKKSIIAPISQYLGLAPRTYKSYFELEGGLWPDLFGRFEDKKDDIDSRTQFLANPRSSKLYSSLLTAVLNKKLQENKGDLGKTQKQIIAQFMGSLKEQFESISNKDKGEKP